MDNFLVWLLIWQVRITSLPKSLFKKVKIQNKVVILTNVCPKQSWGFAFLKVWCCCNHATLYYQVCFLFIIAFLLLYNVLNVHCCLALSRLSFQLKDWGPLFKAHFMMLLLLNSLLVNWFRQLIVTPTPRHGRGI